MAMSKLKYSAEELSNINMPITVVQVESSPEIKNSNTLYMASDPGVYSNFGGVTLVQGEIALIFGKNGEWNKKTLYAYGTPHWDNINYNDLSITKAKLSQAVQDLLDAMGGGSITNNPDDIYLETKAGNVIGPKNWDENELTGKRGTKYITEAFDFTNIPNEYRNCELEIRYIHDLDGADFTLPSNVLLRFAGGKIINAGTITLNDCSIKSDRNDAFENCSFSGACRWNIKCQNITELSSLCLPIGTTVDLINYSSLATKSAHTRVLSETDDGSGIEVSGGNYANISPAYKQVKYSWFGANDTEDSSSFWNKACSWCIDNSIELFIDGQFFGTNFLLEDLEGLKIGGIKGKSKLSATSTEISSVILARCNNLTLSNIWFKCPADIGGISDTVRIYGSTNVTIENCIVEGSDSSGNGTKGLRIADIYNSVQLGCSDVKITGCTLFNGGDQNLWIEGECNSIMVANCFFYGAKEDEFGMDKGSSTEIPGNVTVSGCIFNNTSNHAIFLKSAKDVAISNCIINQSSAGGSPVQLGIDSVERYIDNITITATIIKTDYTTGIYIGSNSGGGYTKNLKLLGTRIEKTNSISVSAGVNAIRINNHTNGIIEGCEFVNFNGFGVKADDNIGLRVKNNTFRATEFYVCFRAVNGSDIIIRDNEFTGTINQTNSIDTLGSVTSIVAIGNYFDQVNPISSNVLSINNVYGNIENSSCSKHITTKLESASLPTSLSDFQFRFQAPQTSGVYEGGVGCFDGASIVAGLGFQEAGVGGRVSTVLFSGDIAGGLKKATLDPDNNFTLNDGGAFAPFTGCHLATSDEELSMNQLVKIESVGNNGKSPVWKASIPLPESAGIFGVVFAINNDKYLIACTGDMVAQSDGSEINYGDLLCAADNGKVKSYDGNDLRVIIGRAGQNSSQPELISICKE